MRRLLWKELRERSGWLALWIVVSVVVTATAGRHILTGMSGSSLWALAPPLFGLLAGLGAYGSELQGERAAFVYSRGVSWKLLLLAKLLPGLAAMLLATGISLAAAGLAAPSIYHPFFTLHDMLQGAGIFALINGVAFLAGFAFSIVLPGLTGAIVAFLGYAGLVAVFANVSDTTRPLIVILATCIAPAAAAILTARFGLTLGLRDRLRRFVLIVVSILLISLLDFAPPIQRLAGRIFAATPYTVTQVSPDGRLAYINANSSAKRQYVIHLASGKQFPVPDIFYRSDTTGDPHRGNSRGPYWINESCLLYTLFAHDGHDGSDNFFWWDGRTMRLTRLVLQDDRARQIEEYYPSPDGRHLLLRRRESLTIFTLRTGARQEIALTRAETPRKHSGSRQREGFVLRECWWQANDLIGYVDPFTRQRVLVTVQ